MLNNFFVKILLPFLNPFINQNMSVSDWITMVFIISIVGLSIFVYVKLKIELSSITRSINECISEKKQDNSTAKHLLDEPLKLYNQTFKYKHDDTEKTSEYAYDYFNEASILDRNLNLRFYFAFPGVLVGLGILGTFVGLTYGVVDFHTGSSEIIQKSISGLLGGMSTAFATSIWGMICSILFNFAEKLQFGKVKQKIFLLCKYLDEKNKLSAADERDILIREEQEAVQNALNSVLDELFVEKDSGEKIKPAHVLRDLLRESREQTQALKAFSTDLAEGISLSTETIEALGVNLGNILTNSLSSSLDRLNDAVNVLSEEKKESAGGFVEKVVTNLQDSMQDMIDNFQNSLSGSAMQSLENLAEVVSSAGSSLQVLPDRLSESMVEFNQQMQDMQNQMQEVSINAGKEVSNSFEITIGKLQESTENLTVLIETLRGDAENTSKRLNENAREAVTQVNATMTNGVTSISESIGELIAREQKITEVNASLFETFSASIEKNNAMNSKLSETINGLNKTIVTFEELSSRLLSSSTTLQSSQDALKSITVSFREQNDKYLENSKEVLKQLETSLDTAKSVSQDYSEKFRIIQQGLSSIFGELEDGLSNYGVLVKEQLNNYLSQVTEQLEDALTALHSSVEEMTDIVEAISESKNS